MTPVAVAIGKGAEYGWTVLIKQEYVNGVGFSIAAGACVILLFVFIWLVKKMAKGWSTAPTYDQEGYIMGTIFFSLFGVGCFIGACSFGWNAAAHFINPDYYAIKFLLETVNQK